MSFPFHSLRGRACRWSVPRIRTFSFPSLHKGFILETTRHTPRNVAFGVDFNVSSTIEYMSPLCPWSHAWKNGLTSFLTTSLKRTRKSLQLPSSDQGSYSLPSLLLAPYQNCFLTRQWSGALPCHMAASEARASPTICGCFLNNPEKTVFTVMGLVSSMMKAVLTGASSRDAISITEAWEDG